MKMAGELIPWKVTDISLRPFKEMWSMNPSIHFDGMLWRCLLRCTDYAMPDGVAIRSSHARPDQALTRNAMVIFDPAAWKPIEVYKVYERDSVPRTSCASLGYEDLRIFMTGKGGLQGIAASLQLKRGPSTRKQIPEQVLLTFGANYDIVDAKPIRGGSWSDAPQKNWVPFDCCTEPRFLYSIGRGTMFDEHGALHDGDARVDPSQRQRHWLEPDKRTSKRARERAERVARDRSREYRRRKIRRQDDFHEIAGSAVAQAARYDKLRGGTQLIRIATDQWLGIGHEMQFVKDRKYYWHTWYLVDSRGKMKTASSPMKLAPNGIEFAAGLAVDGDRVVVSFGVDDMECFIGETRLSAVLALLKPIGH